jgi:selenide, water dikinase
MLGFDTADDAAVYKIDDDNAAVLTLDFFTPVVDDPYEYGAIAAANALSDVFAMGARPVTALNILAFPSCMGKEVVSEVLRGGADKVREAGAFVVGGHSIEDDEPKYGLSVFGLVNPKKLIRNGGALPGDALYYTKTLGTGIMNAALRAKLKSDADLRPIIDSMMELNKAASEAGIAAGMRACTDVTGFGLVGHLHEMVDASACAARIRWDAIPLFDGVYELSCDYCRPGKTFGIIDWASEFVEQGDLDDYEYDNRMGVLCDPQSSGGLLVAVPPENTEIFEAEFERHCGRKAARIGEFIDGKPGTIQVEW